MKPGTRRALLGVMSVAAVLLPAVGIAYLGAVSYQEDRGIVAARIDEQFRGAQTVAGHVERELRRTLDAVAERFSLAEGRPAPAALAELEAKHPLASLPFRIGPDDRLRYPARDPLRPDAVAGTAEPDFLARAPRTCPERGFDACIRAIRAARRRTRQLQEARRRELGDCAAAETACRPDARDLAEARRSYTLLARYDDTGPAALLGLARIAGIVGEPATAIGHYRSLSEGFGNRLDPDGVSYGFVADLGIAGLTAEPEPRLETYRTLVARAYPAPGAALAAAAAEVRTALADDPLSGAQRRELAGLDERLARARSEARFAAGLAGEIDEIARTAAAQPRGRPALDGSGRTLVFQRAGSGGVIGVVVDNRMLEQVAASAEVDVEAFAAGARAEVDRVGAGRASSDRVLASSGFGPLLPHLELAVINDRARPDPLDEIVRDRGRRHLAITGVLVALLVLGLIATIRSAARARDLARLKSDFVSTVSHELKTPLTSIRMFAEMLQQGVAGADRSREGRYHDIIVKESQRLGLLIANLLDYAQIERGIRRYQQRSEPVGAVAREAVETFRRFREGERHDVRLHVDDAAADVTIYVDREVIVQSLLNLLANAAKYGGPDQPIRVEVSASAGRVVLAVIDRGPGIPAGEQQRIFREFYRSPAAYAAGVEGTGLGLALVKRHVEAQGGAVTVESSVGRGARFALAFPAVADLQQPAPGPALQAESA